MGIFERIKKTAEKFKPQYTLEELRERVKYRLSVKDYETAAEYLQQAADMGDADSQFELARLCYEGKSKLLDEREILIWLEKAAVQGHLAAQMELGDMYKYGLCGLDEEDYDKGIYWFSKAAEQGDIEAMMNAGDMSVVVGEKEKAREWYQRAYDAGCEYALKEIEMLDEDFDDEDDEEWL